MSSDPVSPSERLHRWLIDKAYPLWWRVGVDPAGGFFERIDDQGRPVRGLRRARVAGRQIYAFARAPGLGWTGPAEQVVRHGVAALSRFRREDGLMRARVTDEGSPVEEPIDLYDQAFVLFGLAHALPFAQDPRAVIDMAKRLRVGLDSHAHPAGGFEEALPRTLPLKANPHMHLLEAGLAWGEAPGRPDGEAWDAFADGLAELALARFVEPGTGAVHEFYDGDWSRETSPDLSLIEPGHQFEWGWLLVRWGLARGRVDAVAAGERLVRLGEAHGVDPATGLTLGQLTVELTPRPSHARVWAQGERIKAWAQAAVRADGIEARRDALERMEQAAAALETYLHARPPGTWHDRIDESGAFVAEAAPASSLYHIVSAVEEAARTRQAG